MNDETSKYYNNNAREYSEATKTLKIDHLYERFLKDLPENGKILDIGCGSGRDSLHFKNKGYSITAIEPSEELANLASTYIKQEVLCLKAQNIDFNKTFDGVWCMASLLHLKPEDLKETLVKISKSLVENGKFYASFKVGEGEEIDNKGRYFNYMTAERFKAITTELNIFKNIQFSNTNDEMKRDDTQWLNITANNDLEKLENSKSNKITKKIRP